MNKNDNISLKYLSNKYFIENIIKEANEFFTKPTTIKLITIKPITINPITTKQIEMEQMGNKVNNKQKPINKYERKRLRLLQAQENMNKEHNEQEKNNNDEIKFNKKSNKNINKYERKRLLLNERQNKQIIN